MTPTVSIVMPVYNGERYLQSAIESVLGQTFIDFECLIINDGSTDASETIVRSFSDPRIHYTKQENKGLTQTLNDALSRCKGTFLARMDQDDISEPERIQKQVHFMNQHPEIGVLGTTVYIMDEKGAIARGNPSLLNDPELQVQLLYQTPFSHGSVMIRHALLLKMPPPYYQPSAGNAEDYGFWSRLASVTKLANLPEPLYGWRDNPTGMSNSGFVRQREFANKVRVQNLTSPHFQQQLLNFLPNMRQYANERLTIHGVALRYNRKDNYSYLLFRLGKLLWGQGYRTKSLRMLTKILFDNPKYFARALVSPRDGQ